ncbi:MAG: hypothetical protein HY401_09885 [Elusimicrobia bacterium]|nr:hypothetical protein [Elusimicrobiota bacterium]
MSRHRAFFVLLIVVLGGLSHALDHQFGAATTPDPAVVTNATKAGFLKAKTAPRQSVTIWIDPGVGTDLTAAINAWNALAGWELFRQTRDQGAADVKVYATGNISLAKHGTAYIWPSLTEPYYSCRIYLYGAYEETMTLQHELGHCLGFADHVTPWYLESNPKKAGVVKVCDQANHPQYSPYKGIMSYCTQNLAPQEIFGADDLLMLLEAGYIEPERMVE